LTAGTKESGFFAWLEPALSSGPRIGHSKSIKWTVFDLHVPFLSRHSKDTPEKGKFSRQRRGFYCFKPLISVSREITAAKLGQMNRTQVLFERAKAGCDGVFRIISGINDGLVMVNQITDGLKGGSRGVLEGPLFDLILNRCRPAPRIRESFECSRDRRAVLFSDLRLITTVSPSDRRHFLALTVTQL
jgi:hypothetical protein